MKAHPDILLALNFALADELAAILQYTVHAQWLRRRGLNVLADVVMKRARVEMEHVEHLMDRVLECDGVPVVQPHAVHLGKDVKDLLEKDRDAEVAAIGVYNDGVKRATDLGDNVTRALFEQILAEENEHLAYLEAALMQIETMGLAGYLQTLV